MVSDSDRLIRKREQRSNNLASERPAGVSSQSFSKVQGLLVDLVW